MTEESVAKEDLLTKEEEIALRASLEQMVDAVKSYCERNGKLSASEKRIIKAMKTTTDELAEEIVLLYQSSSEVDDLSLLDVVNRNREKILNDILNAALTPKRKLLSEEAKEVITMVSQELMG
ncbi:MAG: hypothetical protein ACTSUR_01815 [Candidatus Heimdallarchaeaceae archaeon]